MLEFVKKDKLEMVSNKIKNIYDKRVGKDKTTFVNNFVDRYKDNPALYNKDFCADIKIVRENLEARFGKERLAEVIKSKYESSFKNRGISYEEAEENILRWYYKLIYS